MYSFLPNRCVEFTMVSSISCGHVEHIEQQRVHLGNVKGLRARGFTGRKTWPDTLGLIHGSYNICPDNVNGYGIFTCLDLCVS